MCYFKGGIIMATTNIHAKAALELLNVTGTRNTVADGISDHSIMSMNFSECFIINNNDTKTFKVENLFIPFGSGATRIMRDMLAEYSLSYPDQTLGERLYVIDKLWTIVMGKAPKENEQKAIKAAIMLDEWLFFAMQGYWEIQYACSDYYEVQKWNLDCYYPIIVLVMALALYDGRYVRDMCEAAKQYLNPNEENHVKAVRLLEKWNKNDVR